MGQKHSRLLRAGDSFSQKVRIPPARDVHIPQLQSSFSQERRRVGKKAPLNLSPRYVLQIVVPYLLLHPCPEPQCLETKVVLENGV